MFLSLALFVSVPLPPFFSKINKMKNFKRGLLFMQVGAFCHICLLAGLTITLVKMHANFKEMLNILPEGLRMIHP